MEYPTIEDFVAAAMKDKLNYGPTADRMVEITDQFKKGLLTCEEFVECIIFTGLSR